MSGLLFISLELFIYPANIQKRIFDGYDIVFIENKLYLRDFLTTGQIKHKYL